MPILWAQCWAALGVLGGSGEALGALLGGSRGVLGGSREVLGASWEGSREVLSIPGAPRPPRRPMLDRFGADLGSNLGPGAPENTMFSLLLDSTGLVGTYCLVMKSLLCSLGNGFLS